MWGYWRVIQTRYAARKGDTYPDRLRCGHAVRKEVGAMRRSKIAWLPGCLVIVFVIAGQARAEFVTATLNGTGLADIISPGATVSINLGDGTAPGISYKPGFVNWTGSSTNSPAFRGQFTTFCLELTQDINPGTAYTYIVVSLENAPKPGSPATGGPGGMGTTKAN